MSRRRNKGQNKPPTKPSVPVQRQQGQAGPQEGQPTLQEGQATLQEGHLQVTEEFSGPLPPADELEKYEHVSPGASERIIAMAETESSRRHELKKTIVDNEHKEARMGQICGGNSCRRSHCFRGNHRHTIDRKRDRWTNRGWACFCVHSGQKRQLITLGGGFHISRRLSLK